MVHPVRPTRRIVGEKIMGNYWVFQLFPSIFEIHFSPAYINAVVYGYKLQRIDFRAFNPVFDAIVSFFNSPYFFTFRFYYFSFTIINQPPPPSPDLHTYDYKS